MPPPQIFPPLLFWSRPCSPSPFDDVGEMVEEAEGIKGVSDDLSDCPRHNKQQHRVGILNLSPNRNITSHHILGGGISSYTMHGKLISDVIGCTCDEETHLLDAVCDGPRQEDTGQNLESGEDHRGRHNPCERGEDVT